MKSLASLMFAVVVATAQAEDELPRLELGIAVSALSAPDYRGSRDHNGYLIPFPYIKYRGDRLRVDEGAKGLLVDRPGLEISLSGNFTLPVDDDTPEREGMDELEPTVEIGPSVNYRFHRLPHSAWWFDLPLRFAYTLDRDFEHIGYVLNPRLSWRKPARRLGQWKLRFNTGPLYASDDYHAYFYSIGEADATPGRPAYSAESGYSGLRSEFTWSRRIRQYWFGGFLRYDYLRHSEIEDSPLVSESDSWVAGISLGYVFVDQYR